jgi:hypothetical protein
MRARTLAALAPLVAVAALVLPSIAQAAPPPNDNFAAATVVDPGALPFSDTVDNSQASTEPGEPIYCLYTPRTVWYAITPSSSGLLRADMAGTSFFDPVLRVFRQNGSDISGLGFLGCASPYWNGQSSLTFAADAGVTYYVQASDYFSGGGNLHLSLRQIPPPANDNFADATPIGGVPYSNSVDTSAATVEAGEPSLCTPPPSQRTAWYAYTAGSSGSVSASVSASFAPVGVAVYTGSSLGGLSQLQCGYGQAVTLHVDAGTTYYFQVGSFDGQGGPLQFNLVVPPPPTAGFSFYPGDPSIADTLQFYDYSYDPAGTRWTQDWDFGDGATATGCCPTHRYAADGDYTAKLAITTPDGRTASATQVMHVRTHDVVITKLTVPQTAMAGQTRVITVGLSNTRYPETVQLTLLRSVPASGYFVQVGTLTQSVPVRTGNRTTAFSINYTFTADDAAAGKVTFEVVASLQGARDAFPGDNTVVALPTTVNG